MASLVKVADGFHFLEGPRWRDNRLWISDMHGHKVHTINADGNIDTIAEENGISYFFWILTIVSLAASLIAILFNPIIKKLMHGVR